MPRNFILRLSFFPCLSFSLFLSKISSGAFVYDFLLTLGIYLYLFMHYALVSVFVLVALSNLVNIHCKLNMSFFGVTVSYIAFTQEHFTQYVGSFHSIWSILGCQKRNSLLYKTLKRKRCFWFVQFYSLVRFFSLYRSLSWLLYWLHIWFFN